MTTTRRLILLVYLLAVGLLCVWVPWRAVSPGIADVPVYVGYGLLWKGPGLPRVKPDDRLMFRLSAIVDKDRWLGTLLAITALCGVVYLLLPGSGVPSPPSIHKSLKS